MPTRDNGLKRAADLRGERRFGIASRKPCRARGCSPMRRRSVPYGAGFTHQRASTSRHAGRDLVTEPKREAARAPVG